MIVKIFVALFLISLNISFANAQAVNGPPYIAVHGHSEKEVVPDIFPLEIVLSETSFDASKTQKKIEDLAAATLQLAKKNNLSDGDISIGNLDIEAEEKYNDKTEVNVFIGNSYTRKINLRFRSLKEMKSFISEFPTAKEVKISTSAFSNSKAREIKAELLKLAVENARADAEILAQSVGKKIIGVQNISNTSGISGYSNYSNVDAIQVIGARTNYNRLTELVMAEGVTTIKQDVYIIYLLGQ
jgi:uncharacterized protein